MDTVLNTFVRLEGSERQIGVPTQPLRTVSRYGHYISLVQRYPGKVVFVWPREAKSGGSPINRKQALRLNGRLAGILALSASAHRINFALQIPNGKVWQTVLSRMVATAASKHWSSSSHLDIFWASASISESDRCRRPRHSFASFGRVWNQELKIKYSISNSTSAGVYSTIIIGALQAVSCGQAHSE